MSAQVRGEGRTEEGRAPLTGLNLVYPGLLVFYVEVQRVDCDASDLVVGSVCCLCVCSV